MTERQPWKFLDDYRGSAFSGQWPTLPELFRITASRYPDRACFTVYDPDRVTLTYSQALARVEKLAAFLASEGVKYGQKVAVTGKNSPEWAVAYLAVLFAGAVVVPIDYQVKNDETVAILKASDAVALFVDEEKYDALDPANLGLRARWSLSRKKPGYCYDLEPKPGTAANTTVKEADLAALLFTSGTTGVPKGVMLTHLNFVSDCFLAQGNLSIYHTDVFYALLPIHHSYTMLAVFIEALSVGAEIVFGQRMVTKAILKDLKEAKVTMFLGVPLLFNKVLGGIMKGLKEKGALVYGLIRFLMVISGFIKKAFKVNPGKKMFGAVLDKASLRTIRICISGGGPLAPSVFRMYNQLGIDFVQGYGLTETSPIITLNPTEAYKEESVGKVIPGTEMKIIDPDDEGRGQIVVKGPMVMRGYYRNEAATAEVLSDGWLLTGDVGYLDADDYLYLTGRAKNLIVTEGGKNVYPEEIENKFQLYGEVEQVLIKGYQADKKQKIEGIEAYLYPSMEWFDQDGAKTGRKHDAASIEAHLRKVVDQVNAAMLPYQRIGKVTILPEPLEMTTTKKVKRFVATQG
ncbi:MAG: long-chain fatty acid--CoA ligase [Spirochaetae bacterium HGW-Spirochaetae-7]|jgi:long-chain acyl-CoA synthetase|nr:MAG: long-chain fatty acid--CoA ligase [Spirochaetae bacterium HGW-Spirochaetae-7]